MSLYHAWDSSQKVAVNGAGTGVKALGLTDVASPVPATSAWLRGMLLSLSDDEDCQQNRPDCRDV